MVRSYYAEIGIAVYDIKRVETHQVVCAACSCPAGHTLYLLVDDNNVAAMLQLGFEPASAG